jgi:hypothetical protein
VAPLLPLDRMKNKKGEPKTFEEHLKNNKSM